MNKVLAGVLSAVLLAVLCEGNPAPYRHDRYIYTTSYYDRYSYETTPRYRYNEYDDYFNSYNRNYNRPRERSFLETVERNVWGFVENVYYVFRDIGRTMYYTGDNVLDFTYYQLWRPLEKRLTWKFNEPVNELFNFIEETYKAYDNVIYEINDIFTKEGFGSDISVEKEKTEVARLRNQLKERKIEIGNNTLEETGAVETFLQELIQEARHQLAGNIGHLEEDLWTKIKKLELKSTKVRGMALDHLDQLSRITSNFFEKIEEFNSEIFGKGTKGKGSDYSKYSSDYGYYGNNTYSNNPYGNNTYSNNPYGNNMYSYNPYGNNTYYY